MRNRKNLQGRIKSCKKGEEEGGFVDSIFTFQRCWLLINKWKTKSTLFCFEVWWAGKKLLLLPFRFFSDLDWIVQKRKNKKEKEYRLEGVMFFMFHLAFCPAYGRTGRNFYFRVNWPNWRWIIIEHKFTRIFCPPRYCLFSA